MTVSTTDICRSSAIDQLALLAAGHLSAVELLAEIRRRFDRVNTGINAVVTVDFDTAEQIAAESDRRRAKGLPVRALEGLPVAVKDLEDTEGMRTTYGSTLFADHVPNADSLVVERMRAAGAVIFGKTNTPEFGTGSHTYNAVFGTTRNPYDTTRSAGGSSGGAAAALATGLTSVADGSDMGGSLRNPAAFCNIVGLRPSIGRVPDWPSRNAWDTLSTNGPMARTVADAVLLLSVISGGDERTPLAFPEPFYRDVKPLEDKISIGWSRTLGGLDIQTEVTEALDETGLPTLLELGHKVIDVEPNFSEADFVFRTLRGLNYARTFGGLLDKNRETLSPELVANADFGLGLELNDYFEAREQRTRLYDRTAELFRTIDVLAAPVTAVLPFDASMTWPREINGVRQQDYLEWMRASWRITPTGFAAMSLPCGFSAEGLPVGLQLIAPPRCEDRLLALAASFERARPA